MRHRLGLVLVLTFAAGCSNNASSGPSSTGCKVNTDCEAGELCTDGACIQICSADTACGDGRICVEQLCVPGTRQQPPTIDSIDGDGSADGAADHTGHHIVRRLNIHGENLAGVEVTLSRGDTDYGALEVCSSTDGTAVVELPDGLLADATNPTQYTLTVANEAGECQATMPILQGEPGEPGEPQTSIDGLTGGDIAGDVTVSGDLSVTGDLAVTGNLTVTGRLDLYRRDKGLVLFGRTPNGVTASHNSGYYGWIEFPTIFSVDPIVHATIDESLNDTTVTWLRTRRETRRAVGLRANAATDAVNWMAIEPGVHSISDKQVAAGKHAPAINGDAIFFSQPFPSPPVVLILPDESGDNGGTGNARVFNTPQNGGFEIWVDSAGDGMHWIAMEPGDYTYGRYSWHAGTFDGSECSNPCQFTFETPFPSAPTVLLTLHDTNNSGATWIRLTNVTREGIETHANDKCERINYVAVVENK